MNKPTPITSITIQLPDNIPHEKQQEISQAMIKKIREQSEREQRDYVMFQRGRNSVSGGLFGMFGF